MAIFLVCKHFFCYLNVLTIEGEEPIVSRANEPVFGTLILVDDLTYSIAIAYSHFGYPSY